MKTLIVIVDIHSAFHPFSRPYKDYMQYERKGYKLSINPEGNIRTYSYNTTEIDISDVYGVHKLTI